MKQPIRFAFWILMLFASTVTKAQDPYFSQFFMSPMTLNPALTGKNVANWRIMMNRKTQWWGEHVQSFVTNALSVEKNILYDSSIHDQLTLGMIVLNDVSAGGLLKSNYFMISSAYNNALDGEGHSLLGIGLAISYANRITDPSKFLFQSQFGSMGFNPNIAANDPILTVPSHYLDIHTGVHYSYTGSAVNYHVGISMFHIGKTQDGVATNQDQYVVPARFLIQSGIGFQVNKESKARIEAMLQRQGANTILHSGLVYTMPVNSEKQMSMDIGVWTKSKKVIYPYLALQNQVWKLGLSYDIATGDLQSAYQSPQSLEISFALSLDGKKKIWNKRTTSNMLY